VDVRRFFAPAALDLDLVIASRKATKQSSSFFVALGLLRFARNDGTVAMRVVPHR
jgi:hypothetical protein